MPSNGFGVAPPEGTCQRSDHTVTLDVVHGTFDERHQRGLSLFLCPADPHQHSHRLSNHYVHKAGCEYRSSVVDGALVVVYSLWDRAERPGN